jgi:subtilisin family serine protease
LNRRGASRWQGIALAALSLAVVGIGPAVGLPGLPNPLGTDRVESRALDGGRVLAAPDFAGTYVPGQLLVKLAPGMVGKLPQGNARARAALTAAGAHAVLDTIPQLGLALVETAPGADLNVAAADLAASPDVEWAEPNYIFGLDFIPNDPDYATKQLPYPLGLMQVPAAWDYTIGRPQVVIAILDTGVDMAHPDLQDGIWTNSDEAPGNGVDDDNNGFIDDVHAWDFADNDNLPTDDHGHGTHVAGIAAARVNNGIGIAGVAGRATIMPVDVFKGGIGTYDSLIRAIIYATDNGAQVINMSLGATSYSRGEQAAVDYAWSHGVLLVASAGNLGNVGFSTYTYPAAHTNVIAVGATDTRDQRASFSSYGDYVDVTAPGSSVWSTYPGNSYRFMGGTSMAAPHVSGLAALVLSLNPEVTPDLVRDLIEQHANDLGTPGWDPYFGYGRINALQTLAMVKPNLDSTPAPTPGPPLEVWPPGCQELIPDGDFETGFGGWQASGSVSMTYTLAYSGTRSAALPGGVNSHGVLTRTLELPSFPMAGTLWFAYRISSQDGGYGSSPPFSYDDWLTVEFRSQDGQLIRSLLRTGNSADSVSDGLPWDQFLFRMQPADFLAFTSANPVNLVFTAGNDGDSERTHFWVDAVRFCVAGADNPTWPDLVAVEIKETGLGCSGSAGDGVEFTVANQGQAEASNFYVRVSAQPGPATSSGGMYNEWHVTNLPPGESLKLNWGGVPGFYTYAGTVDEQNVVVESNEFNNELSRELQVEAACTSTPTATPTATATATPTATPTPTPQGYRVILLIILRNAPLPAGAAATVPTATPAPAP